MKTPEEIKKGLDCCAKGWEVCSENCTYEESHGSAPKCMMALEEDALAYIKQLEEKVKAFQAETKEAEKWAKRFEQERDALLAIVKGYRDCEFCKHGCPPEKEEYLFNFCEDCDIENCRCLGCTTKNNHWEWRGPCKENTENP